MLDIGPFKTVPLSDEEEIGAMKVARLKQIWFRSVKGSHGVHCEVRRRAYKLVGRRVCEASQTAVKYIMVTTIRMCCCCIVNDAPSCGKIERPTPVKRPRDMTW